MKFTSHMENSLHIVRADELDITSAAQYMQRERPSHTEVLAQKGAILFRGFDLKDAEAFAEFGRDLITTWMPYRDRASKRSVVCGPILTSTDTPASYPIALHSESSFAYEWPRKILFFCRLPPGGGGRTPIADTRKIYADIDLEVRDKFERLGVMYYRNFYAGVGMNWREVFQIDDPGDLDRYCASAGIQTEWLDQEHLRTVQARSAVSNHPSTGEKLWFNHALALSQYSLDAKLRSTLLRQVGPEGVPHNTFFGDGSPISEAEYDVIRQAHARNTIWFDWAPGDVLLLDNMLMTHGREPYTGEREIYAALADPLCWPDIGQTVELPVGVPSFDAKTSEQQTPPLGGQAAEADIDAWLISALNNELGLAIEDLTDGFIDCGGDSVMAVELLDLAISEFGVEFDLDEFLEAETLAKFAQAYAFNLQRG